MRCERERAGYVAVGTKSTCTRVYSVHLAAQVAMLAILCRLTLLLSVVLLVLLLWCLVLASFWFLGGMASTGEDSWARYPIGVNEAGSAVSTTENIIHVRDAGHIP